MKKTNHCERVSCSLSIKMSMLILILFIAGNCAFAQSAGKQITLECSHEPLATVLKKIEKTSGYKVLFTYDEVQNYKVSVSVKQQSVESALKSVLANTPFVYTVKGKFINVTLNRQNGESKNNKSRHITGKVVDQKNEPLIGTTIKVQGQNIGTVTDFNGNFSLDIPSSSTAIDLTYIGMDPQTINVGDKNTFRIVMKESQHLLDDVVVTGYQTLSKERSTGSFGKITSETLELKRMNSLSNMMEGEFAGYVDGKIRGITTMNAISNPLVVVDGFPIENTSMDQTGTTTENMPDINPEDIESITILKDAAAASIYGARAANGVVVIITKKAKQGKTDISFSTTFTVQPYSYYTKNLTDAADVISLEEAWASQNVALLAGGAEAEKEAADIRENGMYPSQGVDILLDMYTNKISAAEGRQKLNELSSKGYEYYNQAKKYTKRNPFYQQYNLRVAKTTDRNSVNFSTSYWKNNYEDVNSSDWKLGVNLTNSLKVTKWLQADLGVYLKYGETDSQSFDAYSPGYSFLPYNTLVNSDGSYTVAPAQSTKDRRDLIEKYGLKQEQLVGMNELNYGLGKTKTLETRANARLKVDFTSWLNYNVMFQYETTNDKLELLREQESDFMTTRINNFTSQSAYGTLVYNLPEGDALYLQANEKRAYNFRQQLNLNKTFGKHNIAWILGQELRHTKLYYEDDTHYGYDPELLTWPALNENTLSYVSGILGAARLSISPIKKELLNRFVSFYSNGSYTFDDKYVVSGSIRWDKSNLWGQSSKYQNRPLWSVGGSWNIDKEKFFKVPFIDMLKLRASYGIGGNIGRNTAPYLIAQYFSAYKVDGLAGVVTSPPNKDIRWEKTTTVNIGTDFALFKQRLSGSIEYYHKNSVDLLAMINGSPTQGWGTSTLTTNNGAMINQGVEITLHGSIINKKNFSWNATLLYAYNKNKVTKIYYEPTDYMSRFNLPNSYPTKDEPLNGVYAYRWAGLNKNGDPQVYDSEGNITSDAVEDVDAVHYCGTTVPVHSSTLTNMLRYKNIEFSAMLVLNAGHKLRDANIPAINMSSGHITSTSKDIMNRWRQEGDENITDIPRLLFSNDSENYNTHRSTLYRYSDLFVYNASNIRIRNISLAYRLPVEWCQKVFLSSVKLQFNIENLATIAFDSRAHYSLGGKQKPNFVFGAYLNF